MISCDKCKAPPIAAAVCDRCGAVYRRCATHGAVAGARRSLHSHRALAGAACRPPDRQRADVASLPLEALTSLAHAHRHSPERDAAQLELVRRAAGGGEPQP